MEGILRISSSNQLLAKELENSGQKFPTAKVKPNKGLSDNPPPPPPVLPSLMGLLMSLCIMEVRPKCIRQETQAV